MHVQHGHGMILEVLCYIDIPVSLDILLTFEIGLKWFIMQLVPKSLN